MQGKMNKMFRTCLAELIGTFILVLIGAGTLCASALTSPQLPLTVPALAEGFTLAVVLTVTFQVSTGCLNPAITVMLWVFKRLDSPMAGWLVLMQLLGAALAGLLIRLMFQTDLLIETHLGAPYLKAFAPRQGGLEVSQLISGTAFELFLGLLVTLAAFATLFDRRGPRLGGLMVGLAQSAAVLFGHRFTGGSANPARWFGPAIWEAAVPGAAPPNWLAETIIYGGGPILGAVLAAVIYVNLILPPDKGRESLP
jgi:glycerol uptake facilitator protein